MRLCLGEASKKGEKKEKKPPPGGWRCILLVVAELSPCQRRVSPCQRRVSSPRDFAETVGRHPLC